MNISEAGEFKLIARLTSNLALLPGVVMGVGDVCAVLDLGGETLLLATCDSQVEGVHFTFHTTLPEYIGRKALAINLSDIAAMGGQPRYALVSLTLPSHLPLATLDAIYAGLRQEAEHYATAIVGGNVASAGQSRQLVIDITLLGTSERGHVLTRSGARAGDTLFITGALGDSAAGLYTLLHPQHVYPQEASAYVQMIHRVPRPRVREGRVLSLLGPRIVTALLDVSDGLSGDLGHLCASSQVGALLELAHMPLSPALRAIATSVAHDPFDWVLHGGEDYELLFTVAPGHEDEVIQAMRLVTATPVTAIGTIRAAEEDMRVRYLDGRQEQLLPRSWDHLRP